MCCSLNFLQLSLPLLGHRVRGVRLNEDDQPLKETSNGLEVKHDDETVKTKHESAS